MNNHENKQTMTIYNLLATASGIRTDMMSQEDFEAWKQDTFERMQQVASSIDTSGNTATISRDDV